MSYWRPTKKQQLKVATVKSISTAFGGLAEPWASGTFNCKWFSPKYYIFFIYFTIISVKSVSGVPSKYKFDSICILDNSKTKKKNWFICTGFADLLDVYMSIIVSGCVLRRCPWTGRQTVMKNSSSIMISSSCIDSSGRCFLGLQCSIGSCRSLFGSSHTSTTDRVILNPRFDGTQWSRSYGTGMWWSG